METEEIVEEARKLANDCERDANSVPETPYDGMMDHVGLNAAARSMLQRFAGARSPFYTDACKIDNVEGTAAILRSFALSLERGLIEGRDPKREAQVELVSDILEQAQTLLVDEKVHPAAPAVLIGAALEAFLRTWTEREGITVTGNNGMENYSSALVKADHLTKQDKKDITSWAGLRNHAAHGDWDDVPRASVQNMLQAVNLFLRRYDNA